MRFAKVKAYAEKCGLPASTVRSLCQQGRLPAMRVGRTYYIDVAAADAAFEASVKQSTARNKIELKEQVSCCRMKQFNFLDELAKA